ncbi:hypothetical protein H2248_012163 [Termitomyces sp. 'cryptogamus']|nr:hypothetical protein H2248_012163 [Termitomyces sp. 'cryptogamus']
MTSDSTRDSTRNTRNSIDTHASVESRPPALLQVPAGISKALRQLAMSETVIRIHKYPTRPIIFKRRCFWVPSINPRRFITLQAQQSLKFLLEAYSQQSVGQSPLVKSINLPEMIMEHLAYPKLENSQIITDDRTCQSLMPPTTSLLLGDKTWIGGSY